MDAKSKFIAALMERGDITKEQAITVLAKYQAAKVIRFDSVNGGIEVKHGAFMDRDVIRDAAEVRNE